MREYLVCWDSGVSEWLPIQKFSDPDKKVTEFWRNSLKKQRSSNSSESKPVLTSNIPKNNLPKAYTPTKSDIDPNNPEKENDGTTFKRKREIKERNCKKRGNYSKSQV